MNRDAYLQVLRGAAIAAVVLIHCLPHADASIYIRPLLNSSVALFLFLSGLLSTEEEFLSGQVVSRRLKKTFIPYMVWSIFYWLSSGNRTPSSLISALVLGGSAAQMYYLLVYAQLVLLTPWIYRSLKTHRVLLYAVTPCALLIRECLAIAGTSTPHIQAIFPMWLVFYLFGLDWPNVREGVERLSLVTLGFGLCACYTVQVVSGLAWNAYGNYEIAITQLKLSSMISSLVVVATLMIVREKANTVKMPKPLEMLGNLSFGIYLCHIAVLAIVRLAFEPQSLACPFWVFPVWFLTLGLSAIVVLVCQKLLPKRFLRIVGFV